MSESKEIANGFVAALSPETAADAMKMADWLSRSQMIPPAYAGKPHDIVVAAAMGARLGLDTFRSLQGIAVIKGRPTIWGDIMLGICQARTDWRGQKVTWSGDAGTDSFGCEVSVFRDGCEPYSAHFSIADAKRAGLWGKAGPWTQYPNRMLEVRARAFALRGAFADALAGFHAREEIDDGARPASEGGSASRASFSLDDIKEATIVNDDLPLDAHEDEAPFDEEVDQ